MKYLATIKYGEDSCSRSFDDLKAAKDWLDSENNNLECTTTIAELDDKWRVIDWFFYTEKAK